MKIRFDFGAKGFLGCQYKVKKTDKMENTLDVTAQYLDLIIESNRIDS